MTEKKEAYAVIATGGKQYVIREGDVITIEKLDGAETRKEGDKIIFDEVLIIDDGKTAKIGEPTVKSAKVEAKLIEDAKSKRLHVIKFKSKSRYFRKYGHRQPYTKVEITKI